MEKELCSAFLKNSGEGELHPGTVMAERERRLDLLLPHP